MSERDNRTIVEGARTLLYSNKSLPLTLWAEAVNCFVYSLNRALSSTCPVMTPFESWYSTKSNVSHLRTFGSEFHVLIPEEMRRKLDAKGLLCIFIGNSESQKGDRYWDPSTGKVNVSRDVTPLDHHYTDRLSLPDNQNGVDVFSSNPVGTPPAVPIPLEDISGDPLPPLHDASDDPSDQASLPQEAPLPPQ